MEMSRPESPASMPEPDDRAARVIDQSSAPLWHLLTPEEVADLTAPAVPASPVA